MPLTLHVAIEAIGVKAGEAGSVIMAAAQAIVEVDEVSWVTVFCCAQAIREVAFPVEARPRAWTAGATGRILWYSARPSRALEAFRPVAVPLLNEARRWQEGMWAGALILLLWPYRADASPLFELMHRWLDGAFRDEEFGVVLCLIDFWHLLEKLLASAAVIVPADGKNALVARWGMALLNRSSARATILEELRASKKEDIRVGDTEPLHDAITYLENDAERMDFAATRRNRPIGCGAVEATARAWWPCEWGVPAVSGGRRLRND